MLKLFRDLTGNAFFRHNAIYFIGSLLVAALNYAYHPLIGRILEKSEFGDVQACISLLANFGIIFIVFSYLFAHLVSTGEDNEESRKKLVYVEKFVLRLSVVAGLLIIASAKLIAASFSIASILPVLVLGAIMPVSAMLNIRNARLQGRKMFRQLSISGFIAAAAKLFFAAAFIVFGMAAFGAVTGLLAAQVAALAYAISSSRPRIAADTRANGTYTAPVRSPEISLAGFSAIIIFSVGCINLLYSSDVLWIKYFFIPEEAGLMVGVAAVGKVIFFLTASVSSVLFPHIRLSNPQRENNRTLFQALIMVGSAGGIATLGFFLYPSVIMKIFLGPAFAASSKLLPLASFFFLSVSFANIFAVYLLALRERALIRISTATILSVMALMALNHSAPADIYFNLSLGSAVFLVQSIIVYAKKNLNNYSGVQ